MIEDDNLFHDESLDFDMDGSVLSTVDDAVLIRGIKTYAAAAGLSGNENYIWESVIGNPDITKKDLKIFESRKIEDNGQVKAGVVYTGRTDVHEKFMRLTGLFTRNYINARYMPMFDVFHSLMNDDEINATAIFVPDLFINETEVEKVNVSSPAKGRKSRDKQKTKAHEWKKELLNYLLVKRQSEGKISVFSISSMDLFEQFYGHEISRFIKDHYLIVRA